MKSFPFDSAVTYDSLGNPEYDRAADSALLADFLHLMFTDGVFPNPSTGLQVVASENEMSVVVCPGNTMIQGRMGIEEVARTLVFEASGTSYDRIDAVVARLNTNYAYRDIDLYVVKGTASAKPAAPELTRTGGIYELRLANVFIAKNTTMISAERITDTRLNTEDCGIVTSNPQRVDTTTIFKQYQAALEKYLQYVEECIDGTAVGEITERLNGIDTRLGEANISSVGDGTVTGAIVAQKTAIDALNTDIAKKQDAASAITTSNIGQQSVYYANAAGTAQWATDNTKMPLAGGTFTGAVNFANGTWNKCGDDCNFGDRNIGGCVAFKSASSSAALTGIALIGASTDNMYGRLLVANNGGDMYITTNGKFFVSNGNNSGRAEIVASAFTQSSSRRVKTNITDMSEEEARKILDLTPISFDYISDDMPDDCYGLIAEDTKAIIPSCVSGDVDCPDDDQDAIAGIGIDYSKLVPYLIKIVQIQEKRISELEQRNPF